jgi:hypothetical protein
VFPDAKHAWCQSHYLKNIAEPIATADDAMKVTLRKQGRRSIGQTIRAEQEEAPGVLTVTGLLPSTVEVEPSVTGRQPTAVPRHRSDIVDDAKKKRLDHQRRGRWKRTQRLNSGMRL